MKKKNKMFIFLDAWLPFGFWFSEKKGSYFFFCYIVGMYRGKKTLEKKIITDFTLHFEEKSLKGGGLLCYPLMLHCILVQRKKKLLFFLPIFFLITFSFSAISKFAFVISSASWKNKKTKRNTVNFTLPIQIWVFFFWAFYTIKKKVPIKIWLPVPKKNMATKKNIQLFMENMMR